MIVTVLQLIAVFGVPVLILRQREKGLVRTFGTIAMAYFWGIVVAVAAFLCRKAGLDVRLNADVGQIGSYVCIGLAIPLLMFGTNLADVRRLAIASRRTSARFVPNINSGMASPMHT